MDRIWQWAWDRYGARYLWAIWVVAFASSLDHPGPFARTVRDGAGSYEVAGMPCTFSGSRDLRPEILPVPELGDWTEKALTGIAGYSDQEAAHFTER